MKLLLVLSLLVVTVSADEDWVSSCPCGKIYIPVCATNGISYNNMCEFLCAFEHFIFLLCLYLSTCLGQWSGFAEDCVCTSQYDPVCGGDRRRYYNICKYRCRLEYLRKLGLPAIDTIDCGLLPPPAPIH